MILFSYRCTYTSVNKAFILIRAQHLHFLLISNQNGKCEMTC